MNKVRITNIQDLKRLIQNINEDGSYNIELDDNLSFHAVSDEEYELLSEMKELFEEDKQENQRVKIVSNDINEELSFEQYETLKKLINDAFEKTFKPKSEKLN